MLRALRYADTPQRLVMPIETLRCRCFSPCLRCLPYYAPCQLMLRLHFFIRLPCRQLFYAICRCVRERAYASDTIRRRRLIRLLLFSLALSIAISRLTLTRRCLEVRVSLNTERCHAFADAAMMLLRYAAAVMRYDML